MLARVCGKGIFDCQEQAFHNAIHSYIELRRAIE